MGLFFFSFGGFVQEARFMEEIFKRHITVTFSPF